MVALVSIETVLLVLLVVLVAALLRSHAEILRRLGPESAVAPRVPVPRAGERGDAVADADQRIGHRVLQEAIAALR